MARRAGSLAVERTDYSDRKLFPGAVIAVPLPFARLEDFVFTAHNSLLPPTAKMVTLIDPGRSASPTSALPARLDDAASAMLEAELIHCVRAKSLVDNEPAGPNLRMAILWGRFSDIAATAEQRARAESFEQQYFRRGAHDLALQTDPNFATFGYRYGWGAELILERFAETAGLRPVAQQAWDTAAQGHRALAASASNRRVRSVHDHMANVDGAHLAGIQVARTRTLVGHVDHSLSLRGRSGQPDRHL